MQFTSCVWFFTSSRDIFPKLYLQVGQRDKDARYLLLGTKVKTRRCTFPLHEGTEGSGGSAPPILRPDNSSGLTPLRTSGFTSKENVPYVLSRILDGPQSRSGERGEGAKRALLPCQESELWHNYSRTPIIRKLVIRLANYPDRLGPLGKHFSFVMVLHLCMDWIFPPFVNYM